MARRAFLRTLTVVAAIIVVVVLVPALALAGFLVFVTPSGGDFSPEAWTPPASQQFAAAITTEVAPVALVKQSLFGLDDIAGDSDGRIYTGARDGSISRLTPDGSAAPFAEVGGRPLGLSFLPDGKLIVANHGRGLQQVTAGRRGERARECSRRPADTVCRDLDVSSAGIVYVSDCSWRHNTTTLGEESSSYIFPEMIDGRASGRDGGCDPHMSSPDMTYLNDSLVFVDGGMTAA